VHGGGSEEQGEVGHGDEADAAQMTRDDW
jgi:hypothetical protein